MVETNSSSEHTLRPWSAFAYRDFTMLWLGGVSMMIAMQMRLFTCAQWIYEETGSEFQLGLLGAIQFLQMPIVIYGGILADIFDRKKLMVLTQSISFVALLMLTFAAFYGNLAVWHIYVVHGITGIMNMLGNSARPAMIARVVPRTHLTHAVTTNTATFQIAGIAAPIAFGLIYSIWGVSSALAATTFVLMVSVITPLAIRVSGTPEKAIKRGSFESLKEGFLFVRHHKILPGLYLLDIGVTIFSFYRFLFPIFAESLYGMGAVGVGLLASANSFGGIAGSALVLYTAKMSRKGVLVLVATSVYALLLIAFGSIHIFAIGLVIVAGLGATDAVGMVMRQTIVQLTTPDRLLGRASSAHSFAAMGANNIGQMEVAFMSGAIGAGSTMVLGGVIAFVVIGLVWKFVPGVSSYRYQHVDHSDLTENPSHSNNGS
ncbi:MAG: hypothetical protein CL792_05090 [Chloroflexi bacterium]|nr:hypothetical protein [Chloroflexota bacterium]